MGKIPWKRKWQPTLVFLPRKSHGQRSLSGHSPWVAKNQTTTEQLILLLTTGPPGKSVKVHLEHTECVFGIWIKLSSFLFSSVQFSSVTQSCLTLCDPMNRSMPGLPVHHQLPEFTQTNLIESVVPSSHLILCRSLLLLPPIPPSIGVFSSESTLHMRWPKETQDWSPLGWTGWISLQSKGPARVFSNTTVQKHQFFGTQLSSQSNSHIHT